MHKRNKVAHEARNYDEYYISEEENISTYKDSRVAIGSFSIKYFPLRQPIKSMLEDSVLDDGGVASEASFESMTNYIKNDCNPYKVIGNYYGLSLMKRVIELNQFNKEIYAYLHKYVQLK